MLQEQKENFHVKDFLINIITNFLHDFNKWNFKNNKVYELLIFSNFTKNNYFNFYLRFD